MSAPQRPPDRLPPAVRRFLLPAALALCLALWPARGARADTLIGLNPGGANTSVLSIQLSPFAASAIGPAGFPSLSGLAFQPDTGTLFASSGTQDGGRLFTIDTVTGAATLVGPTGFPAVPGLEFGPGGALYGSADVAGGEANGLIVIDPATGQGALVGLYGSAGPDVIDDISGLAFHPTTGALYGSTGPAFDGTPGDLFTIDPATGRATLAGSLTEAGTGAGLPVALSGLAFDPSGELFGSLGGGDGRALAIDLSTFTFAYLGDAAAGSVSAIAFQPAVAVPEPSALSLVGLATLGLLGYTWRRAGRVAGPHVRAAGRWASSSASSEARLGQITSTTNEVM